MGLPCRRIYSSSFSFQTAKLILILSVASGTAVNTHVIVKIQHWLLHFLFPSSKILGFSVCADFELCFFVLFTSEGGNGFEPRPERFGHKRLPWRL